MQLKVIIRADFNAFSIKIALNMEEQGLPKCMPINSHTHYHHQKKCQPKIQVQQANCRSHHRAMQPIPQAHIESG